MGKQETRPKATAESLRETLAIAAKYLDSAQSNVEDIDDNAAYRVARDLTKSLTYIRNAVDNLAERVAALEEVVA